MKPAPFLLGIAIRTDVDKPWRHLGYIVAAAGNVPFNEEDVCIHSKGKRWKFKKLDPKKPAVRLPFIAVADVSHLPPLKAAKIWPLKQRRQGRRAA